MHLKLYSLVKSRSGFTLVELLIVIAVIGVLASVILVAIDPAKKINEARDSNRLLIMAQTKRALAAYLIGNGNYPIAGSGGQNVCLQNCWGWEIAGCGVPFLKALMDQGEIKSEIKDPSINAYGTPPCSNFRYYRYSAGEYGCDASKGDYYVLGVVDMESTNNPHPKSPGWSCPSRNWQSEFDWVTGEFQK